MRARVPALERFSLYKLGDVIVSPGIKLVAGRCLTAVPVLFVVSLLTFFIVNVLPGSTAEQLAGANATPEQVARLEAALRLDRPLSERYWEWLTNTLTGDLGESLASGQPVTTLLNERLPVTLELTALALLLAIAFAVPLALLAARRPFGLWDRLGMTLGLSGLSLASYVLAPVLVLIFAVHLGMLPSIGVTPFGDSPYGNIRSLILPGMAVAFPLFGLYTRFLRGDLLEQINDHDYILAARAKGIGPWRVVIRHTLPNSLFGLLTVIGLNLGGLIGGTVIIEQIFALPGIGQLLLQAINLRDVIVVQAIVLLLAVVTVLANLLVDVMYAILDPRVRYGRR
jgi:peptide/nickel transport system permease protein